MEVTAASDVYSLGVVAYECLSGERPFDGASQVAIALAHINRPPPPLPADIPPAVRLLVERALAKDAKPTATACRVLRGQSRLRVASGGALAALPGPATTPTPIVNGGLAPGRRFSPRPAPPPSPVPVGLVPARDRPGRCRPCTPRRTTATRQEDEPEDPGRGRGEALSAARRRPSPAAPARQWRLLPARQQPRPRRHDHHPNHQHERRCDGGPDRLVPVRRRPVDEDDRLERLGLVVALGIAPDELVSQAGREFAAEDVVSLDPSDTTVQPQSTVTVYYAMRRAARPRRGRGPTPVEPTAREAPHHERGAPTTSEAPTPLTTAATSSSAVETTATLGGSTAPPEEPSPSPTEEAPAAIEEPTG